MDGKTPVNSDGSNMMDRKADLKPFSVLSYNISAESKLMILHILLKQ